MNSLFQFPFPCFLLFVHINYGSFLGSELECLGFHSWVHKRDIESHKERESSDFPAGCALRGPLPSPHPLRSGWHADTAWPEEGNSDDVTKDRG